MEIPKYNLIEDRLREFLGRICKHVSAANPNGFIVAAAFRDNSISSLNNLEHAEYCHFLIKNARAYQGPRKTILCDQYVVDRTIISDLLFVKDLRNKYSHKTDTFLLKDQLADLLIVQRLVREFGRLRDQDDADLELLAKLDEHISELVVDVAQITNPKEFDTGGEKSSFTEDDQSMLQEVVTRALIEVRPLSMPVPVENTEADVNNPVMVAVAQLQADMGKLIKRSSEPKVLSRKVDEIKSTVSIGMTQLEKLVFELREELRMLSAGESSQVDDEEMGYDDDELDERENLVLLKSQIENIGEMIRTAVSSQLARRPLSAEDARDQLIALRKRIWRETGEGPGPDGLLKRSMIDAFLTYLPKSENEARKTMKYLLQNVSEDQLPYLDEVIAIVSGVDDTLY